MDGWLDGWLVEWMDGWMDGWLDGWLVGWMDGSLYLCLCDLCVNKIQYPWVEAGT